MPQDINLLPQQSADVTPQQKTHKMLNTASILLLVLAIGASVGVLVGRLGIEAQSASVNSAIKAEEAKLTELKAKEEVYQVLVMKLTEVKSFLAKQKHYSQFFTAFNATLPQSVRVTDMQINENEEVSVTAATNSYADLSGFFTKLKSATVGSEQSAASAFVNPLLTAITRNEQSGDITFTIKFTLDKQLTSVSAGGAQ
jgi:Tfp pilus assembly protein PilN